MDHKQLAEAISLVAECTLFDGIDSENLAEIFQCLQVKIRTYEKNQVIFQLGQPMRETGIVMRGNVTIEKTDCWGNRSILAKVEAGDMFGEALACAAVPHSPIVAVAVEKAEILFIDYRKIVTVCSSACVFHSRLIENMMRTLARKNILLTNKIEHLTQRTTREKLLSYLSACALRKGQRSFTIPLSRQELADYLAVDRSAMSHELSKLRAEGVIDFRKNQFILCETAEN